MPKRVSFQPIYDPEKDAWKIDVPARFSDTGKRCRRFFETQEKAKTYGEQLKNQTRRFGEAGTLLPPAQAEEALQAFERLNGTGFTLLEAVERLLAEEERKKASLPFGEVFERYLTSRKFSERHERSMQQAKALLSHHTKTLVESITAEDVEKALAGLAPSTWNLRKRELSTIFNYAMRKGWCTHNPLLAVDSHKLTVQEREVFSVADVKALLNTADQAQDELRGMLPYLAVGIFAGIRAERELLQLRWEHVDLVEGQIDLPAEITKKTRRRSVPIEPCLQKWLEHYRDTGGDTSGFVCPWRTKRAVDKRRRKLCETAEVAWPQNAMRHSFASYWLAKHGDLNKLALALGHSGGLEVLHRHYHRAVKQRDAMKFWEVEPPRNDGGKVIHFSSRKLSSGIL